MSDAIRLPLPDGLRDRIDAVRGDTARVVWIRRAIELQLESVPYADNEAGRAARALGFLPPRTTAEANRQRQAISEEMDAAQARSKVDWVDRSNVPRNPHQPGPNVENIRSSGQSKRDVKPIPKAGK